MRNYNVEKNTTKIVILGKVQFYLKKKLIHYIHVEHA